MKIEELMSTNVSTVSPYELIQDAARKMKESNVGLLPVVDREKIVGVVTDRDLVVRGLSRGRIDSNIELVMTIAPITYDKDMDVDRAIDAMEKHGIGRVLVTDGAGHLCGVLSASDIARAYRGNGQSLQLMAQLGEAHRNREQTWR